jgi:hypothetical protein
MASSRGVAPGVTCGLWLGSGEHMNCPLGVVAMASESAMLLRAAGDVWLGSCLRDAR